MVKKFVSLLVSVISIFNYSLAQTVPIDNYSVSSTGQAQLSIQAQADKYYVLKAEHSPTFTWPTSIAMGVNGTMILTESGAAYPVGNYTVTEHDIASPIDTDGDGLDDITEFNNMPTDAPINFADPIDFVDGSTSIPDAETFMDLATINNVSWAPFLDDQLYVKFGILDRDTDEPKVYFINSNTHAIHANFFTAINANVVGDDGSGEIVFNPNDILPNGVIGSYSFNFSFGEAMSFDATQRTFELLIANMPFLQNNMKHFIGESYEDDHTNNYAADFVGSRITVDLESDVFAEINYIPFHEAEGYGFFKHMENLNETPGTRDIVLYDALPNSLPRVGGIITSVVQTPLSHVNLRAIQDNVPNAYIKNPLSIDSIASLLNGYIYYKVENETFQIREATLEEVNDWFEALRPTEEQIPVRDLSITEIMPLDSIEFEMSTSFGAKCSNVATMRDFGFPDGTIPDGFGIPFYFYDEFMKFNNFYEEAEVMINNPSFINDINFRAERLSKFRQDIKDAPMPAWMMAQLQEMHNEFPLGTSVRCRSSTNNEDLPGFSGAGLYTSKTQHPEEGHISKSVKQIYASMWNFRAYEERDFYRVDHFVAAMGILCHSNFTDEKSNGVGVSADPIYHTDSTFYLNTQVGEVLITNPDPNSVPEEILLYENPAQGAGYLVLRLSNLVDPGELVMDQVYLNQMREYLSTIHHEFSILYDVEGVDGFAMDIEYKVTADDQLIIKQARPWVSFWADIKANSDLSFSEIVNPQSSSTLGNNELITARISNTGLNPMNDFDISLIVDGQLVETITIEDTIHPFSYADYQFTIPQDFSESGIYNITGIVSDNEDEYTNNDTLKHILRNIHLLDGEIAIADIVEKCNGEADANIIVTNHGETTITSVEIEVKVNGVIIGTFNDIVDIPSENQGEVTLTINSNLQPTNNDITFNILSINGQQDGDLNNNSTNIVTDLDSNFDNITLVINPDNFPQETSWEIFDEGSNVSVASASLNSGSTTITENVCVNYNSCFTVYVRDEYGDGICCAYGEGNFQVLNASGDTLVNNNGDFGDEAAEPFCLGENSCNLTADINIIPATSSSANDGNITIYTYSGISPIMYSIDNGQNYVDTNVFSNLSPGTYDVVIEDAIGCVYQETISIEACTFTSVYVSSTDASSVVTTDGSIEITPTSGVGPYQYSIDGGQNFVADNIFNDLPVGPYNVVVQDASNICNYTQSVPIETCHISGNVTSSNASSESASDGVIIISPTSGTAPFYYSIDGGETYSLSNVFLDVDTGTYVVEFLDAEGDCPFRSIVVVGADESTDINDVLADNIKVYPNPIADNINIELLTSESNEPINILIYDNLGRTILQSSISENDRWKTTLSIENYNSGTYFIKCYNNSFEKHFKVVKL